MDEIVDLHIAPFDIGVLHYVSDTPLSKGMNLGAQSLSYFGMDPTYATSLAVLKRILALESEKQAESVPADSGNGAPDYVPSQAVPDRVAQRDSPS